ncbi:MAG TPA: ABC transporter ATP-binding protein [Myxococcota bacterium]|nr:ABC transporter ATP-binding protein [Myxococcota bacterium]HNZ02959.1 ABC transporter ATP-binding protein [Myxococcota bacterium]HOD07159.1 ABC transporter ATP-binding protein [Myxococcota bacterium]HPB49983.1 ABC transporter ATP-binding protein [Myxococcota bacterium]HQP95015.1 ABC transporter ATP-binding protein [Myxococcota bacterium]
MKESLAVVTTSLTRRFGSLVAVDNLNLEVPTGSIFGLLGPNGAGKTTTFSMICGFVRPTEGSVTVLGFPVKEFPFSSGRLSALPQDAKFYPDRTVFDSMIFLGTLGGLTASEAARQSEELLAKVDLTNAGSMKGGHLSHGMMKRFGIAQAFLGRPDLVLLDEPTAGLDPRNAYTIRQMIRALAGTATVVVSSHNLAEVQDLCTHAAIINHGRLVSAGPMDELTSRNQEVVLTIGNLNEAILQRIQALAGVTGATALHDGSGVKVLFETNVDREADQAVSAIVAGAIAAGASVSGVKRGKDLEQRYLEVT